jgi:hypothetical protein
MRVSCFRNAFLKVCRKAARNREQNMPEFLYRSQVHACAKTTIKEIWYFVNRREAAYR